MRRRRKSWMIIYVCGGKCSNFCVWKFKNFFPKTNVSYTFPRDKSATMHSQYIKRYGFFFPQSIPYVDYRNPLITGYPKSFPTHFMESFPYQCTTHMIHNFMAFHHLFAKQQQSIICIFNIFSRDEKSLLFKMYSCNVQGVISRANPKFKHISYQLNSPELF